MVEFLMLLGAGLLAGAASAIAGGGTFFTFPALMATGLDPMTANMSNAVAVYPGHATAAVAYRRELAAARSVLLSRCVVSGAGGLVGAVLLLWLGSAVFTPLVPWLLLTATLIFAFSNRVGHLIASGDSLLTGRVLHFLFAIYGGYFGAGLGVLIMAVLMITDNQGVQHANAQKNLLSVVISTITVIIFVIWGSIAWQPALIVFVGAVFGGYAGGKVARYISAKALHHCVVSFGFFLSAYYFVK